MFGSINIDIQNEHIMSKLGLKFEQKGGGC